MAIGLQTAAYGIGKPIGYLLLAIAVLWQVAVHAGPWTGRALVHVSTSPVDVTIDGVLYRVDTLHRTPIVCELRPGRHTAQMIRDGRILYQEDFHVVAGEDVVLSALDQYKDGRSPGRGETDAPPDPRRRR